MGKIFVTRKIAVAGLNWLRKKHTLRVYPKDQTITRAELEKGVKCCDALLPLLTDKIDAKLEEIESEVK